MDPAIHDVRRELNSPFFERSGVVDSQSSQKHDETFASFKRLVAPLTGERLICARRNEVSIFVDQHFRFCAQEKRKRW